MSERRVSFQDHKAGDRVGPGGRWLVLEAKLKGKRWTSVGLDTRAGPEAVAQLTDHAAHEMRKDGMARKAGWYVRIWSEAGGSRLVHMDQLSAKSVKLVYNWLVLLREGLR